MKQHTITLQVRADRSMELLRELADDERVKAITMQVAPGRYLIPNREKAA